MASYADALLAVDVAQERSEEMKAIKDYLNRLRIDQMKKERGSFVGGLAGGLIGAGFGGAPGMMLGDFLGSAAGQWYEEYTGLEPYSDMYRTLGKEVFEGGKFHKQDMRDWVEEAVQLQEDQKWDEILGTAVDAMTLAWNIDQYGGFEDYSNKTFGEGLQDTWSYMFGSKGLELPEGFNTEAEYVKYIQGEVQGGTPLEQLLTPHNFRVWTQGGNESRGFEHLSGTLGNIFNIANR